ncbi:Calcium-dependent protein kinase 13 [Tetrabaena socialis]|uniref:Calcium-dependent protein kinase 13 n=1 Tax=Tetrabaena socialis TaxID=47790 RepID=A0A2J8AGC7_9CHLO|nr:Calcium-dependent protein kinase 13 [Tetrabaena socialis]|eukprot:PNH11578.1 Calcium-dependent protein kinase 13 [Tetrabaena socialis]
MATRSARLRIGAAHGGAHSLLALPPLQHHATTHCSSPRGAHCGPLQAAASTSFGSFGSSPSGVSSLLGRPELEQEPFLSRFALGPELGQGSFGNVHSAINRASGQEVAVKLVAKQRHAGRNQRSALHREASLWKRACLATAQAGQFHAIEEDASNFYLVSEKCDGGSLQQMLDTRGVLKEAELGQVAWCVLTFLQGMHQNSIYYGDLKPGNVILKDAYPCTAEPPCLNVRVVDFGCSQLVSPGSPLRAMSGSPLFLAPEIISGAYGLPADMWAMGCTLYMLVCNRLPFWLEPIPQLECFDLDAINGGIQYSPVLFAGAKWRGVSEELKDLICGLLEKDPARRLTSEQAKQHSWFANAKEMCQLE